MNTTFERVRDLIAYVKAIERDKRKTIRDFHDHGPFRRTEFDLEDLPGLILDPATDDGDVWLRLDRLAPLGPPDPPAIARPWIKLTNDPERPPTLESTVPASALPDYAANDPAQATVALADHPSRHLIEEAFRDYLQIAWSPWSGWERPRRASIALYGQLFGLVDRGGDGGSGGSELVWGLGLSTWKTVDAALRYPLITIPLEVSVREHTHALEIAPRTERRARLETDVLLGAADPRLVETWRARAAQRQDALEATPAPFRRETFEATLRDAAGVLDPAGVYAPDVADSVRRAPDMGPTLCVTDIWAIFLRDRGGVEVIADLERLEAKILTTDDIPATVAAIAVEPSEARAEAPALHLRGLSSVWGVTSADGTGEDLYFPKPFNEEQVQVVRRLASRPGVVVQGPPGTGKTHTIANIVCHALAKGQRVLVTSERASALREVRDQLPGDIRPLAIALLENDRAGLRGFQDSVATIQHRLSHADTSRGRKAIEDSQIRLDALHRELARLDRRLHDVGAAALARVDLDGQEISPEAAAREVADGAELAQWIIEPLDIGGTFDPPLSDEDVALLRAARKSAAERLIYIGWACPSAGTLPTAADVRRAHELLLEAAEIDRGIASGALPSLKPAAGDVGAALVEARDLLRTFLQCWDEALKEGFAWTIDVLATLRRDPDDPALAELQTLRGEVARLGDDYRHFLTRPVERPDDLHEDPRAIGAIERLAAGRGGLDVARLLAPQTDRRLKAIRLQDARPQTTEQWAEVLRCAKADAAMRKLRAGWNGVAEAAGVDAVQPAGLRASQPMLRQLDHVRGLQTLLDTEREAIVACATLIDRPSIALETREQVAWLLGVIETHLRRLALGSARALAGEIGRLGRTTPGDLGGSIGAVGKALGGPDRPSALEDAWSAVLAEMDVIHGLQDDFGAMLALSGRLASVGAKDWAERLRTEPVQGLHDGLTPGDWRTRWRLRRLRTWLERTDPGGMLVRLAEERLEHEGRLAQEYERAVETRAWLELAEQATDRVKASLAGYANAVSKIGKGTGAQAGHWRGEARKAADGAKNALPCWILPLYRVSESLPSEPGLFDLVIIDEASQSTIAALPALLRAKQVLVVGDDKQVSPSNVGRSTEEIVRLAAAHLGGQVQVFRPSLREDMSLYDLARVVFSGGDIMLQEHFRCVPAIIEYSKRQFYGHRLKPLRQPKASERLDPPLIDVLVEDGYRSGDENPPERDFIVAEIGRMLDDPAFAGRSIGVTTLLGQRQAVSVQEALLARFGVAAFEQHDILVGDPAAFQGRQRDIMFISMVAERGDRAISGRAYEQRFNVAASRARDRMYLVRSIEPDQLSATDDLRRSLIEHFASPFRGDEKENEDRRARCESGFEREMFDTLVERGYRVDTQVRAGHARIDLVIEGAGDRRLAIECDGDRHHGPEQWPQDMARQRRLERAGWRVWRCFASRFVRHRDEVIAELTALLAQLEIEPIGAKAGDTSPLCEHRRWRSSPESLESAEDASPSQPMELEPAPAVEPVDGAENRGSASPEPVSASGALRPDEARSHLRRLRREVIERDFPGVDPDRCLLRDEIIEAIVKGGGDSREAFVKVVPLVMRERIDPRQMRYLDEIYDIVGRIAEADDVWEPVDRGFGTQSFRPYREARLIGEVPADIAACAPRELINPILEIVRQEGPVHEEEIARRLQRRAGGERAGKRVLEAVAEACGLAKSRGAIKNEGPFWRLAGSGAARPRNRAAASATLRNIHMIAPSEIREAARLLIAEHRLSDKAEVIARVARALGYSRVTDNIARTIAHEVLKVLRDDAA